MNIYTTLLLGALAALALALGALVLFQDRERQEQRLVRESIVSYFQRCGLFVSVSCFRTAEGLVALVESELHKKFRFSYLKERTLAEHVKKATGKHIDCVYWRFRVRKGAAAPKDYQEYEAPAPVSPLPSPIQLGRAMAKDLESYALGEPRVHSFEQALRSKGRSVRDGPDFPPAESA